MINVKILLDSTNKINRLTTFEVTYPFYIHAEVMTHRMFSRNFRSFRAIPIAKLIAEIDEQDWHPIFMKNKPGMSANEPLEGYELEEAIMIWNDGKNMACHIAEQMEITGAHKQNVNRILMPFTLMTGIISATTFSNFFSLRIHPEAQQEIQILATKMKDALESNIPQKLELSDWHIPLITSDEIRRDKISLEDAKKISAARCARVSYLTHDGIRDIQKDLELADQLIANRHASPFEHIAQVSYGKLNYANFTGFKQYRQFLGM